MPKRTTPKNVHQLASILQDALHYAIAAAHVNRPMQPGCMESTIGCSRWEGYWDGRKAPRKEWLRNARAAVARSGLIEEIGACPRTLDGADAYARRILEVAAEYGIDAYCGRELDTE